MPSTKLSLPELAKMAKTLRRHIITSTTQCQSGHPTSSMSAVELVNALYFGGYLRHDPKQPKWPARDRFVMSKGHAAPLLYAALAEAGYFPVKDLATLRHIGSPLEGHPNFTRLAGVEASTGSLGQGLSVGLGIALSTRLQGFDSRTYVLLGDGELGEGQVWEAAMAAEKYKASNLIALVDRNGYQQTGPAREVLNLDPIPKKWEAFGWFAQEIDGHDQAAVLAALEKTTTVKDRPSVIVAKTIKGYPIIDMLADKNHHGKPLSPAEAEKALAMLA